MQINIRQASPHDLGRCAEIRGLTRDNPISGDLLVSVGVTTESWTPKLEDGTYVGLVAEDDGVMIGYCFGDTLTAEVLVLAILADYDGRGIGRQLLTGIIDNLSAVGHTELWLAASPDSAIKAHGFYRHMGWIPTGELDDNGDEILRYARD